MSIQDISILEIDVKCPVCLKTHTIQYETTNDDKYCYIDTLKRDIASLHRYAAKRLCPSCKNEEMVCKICGEKHRISMMFYDIKQNIFICDKHKTSYHYIDKYKYYKLKKETSPRLYFGIELECGIQSKDSDGNSQSLAYFIAKLPDCMFAHSDRSIHDSADYTFESDIEIITHPMTYKWLLRHKKMIDDVLSMRSHGLISDEAGSCGMHVHLSRKYFTKGEMYELAIFMHSYEHSDFLYWFGNRTDEQIHWTEQAGLGEVKRWFNQAYDIYNIDSCAKYYILSFTRKRTMECRLFNGTLDPHTFWSNIQFLYVLTKMVKRGYTNISIDDYCNYVKKRAQTYKELSEVLQRWRG